MAAAEISHSGNCIEDASDEQLLSAVSMGSYNIFEDPEILPRVGDEYQVEIPTLITESDPLLLTENPNDVKDSAMSFEFLMGLPVSIMWVSTDIEKIKDEPAESPINSIDLYNKIDSVKSECILETNKEIGDFEPKPNGGDITPDGGINSQEAENLALQQEMKVDIHQKQRRQGYFAVPGTPNDTWNDLEEASFILGLYIFGKNLVQVKKFVESKKMRDILSFYYGKFYKSEKYRRWSECRKMRRKRCIYGQRIFTGWRQQELLSRLLPHVPEECQNTLQEVCKSFGEGKLLLEDFVFSLKATVGLSALISAIGIGKGKEDLTGITLEPVKASQVAPIRPEIPVGKACSTLTSLEIVNFLTGNYRLSKARSNDLFWEAVWPRLLARGWHSEQPPSQGYAAGSKHSLVFLIPGVKKFSRRKLVKGDHYFDSVSDVLSKVASEPGLLELEIGAEKGDRSKEENETESDKDDLPNQKRSCYLKPRTPNHAADIMRFTVVDTSLDNGGKFKVRELRSLPFEMNISNSLSDSEESTSEEITDETDSGDTLCSNRIETNGLKPMKISSDKEESPDTIASNNKFPIDGKASTNIPVIPGDPKIKVSNGMQPKKDMKNQPRQRTKLDNINHLAPVTTRRRRLTAFSRKETTQKAMNVSVACGPKQTEASCSERNPDGSADIPSEVCPTEQLLSSVSSSSKSSPTSRDECIRRSTCAEQTHENHQERMLIDLNLPVLPEAETDEPFMGEVIKRDEHTTRQPDNASQLEANSCMPSAELQPDMNARRQSTRIRPPTTKALEALACGFLSTTQKRKRGDGFARVRSFSRPSSQACGSAKVSENHGDGMVDFKAEGKGNDMSNGNGVMEQTSDLTQMEVDSNLGVPYNQ
ncbi:hypothetical protein CCACVL1_28443 [Corchorus capsularis]|uniref:SANT domain-containing protein n=1 Tax=Corchorus capsularis TaxID=210143 RepID=A0A1R3G6I0_COCAP|nr:hypothetical protein CCACVL1_28443 [Corchorus capsularis]